MVSTTSLPTLNAHGWVVNLLQPSGMCIQRPEGPRTNNNLEVWHSKVKKKIAGKNHVNIFEIIELFKEQAPTEVEIRQLMAGGTEGDRHHVKEIETLESKPL